MFIYILLVILGILNGFLLNPYLIFFNRLLGVGNLEIAAIVIEGIIFLGFLVLEIPLISYIVEKIINHLGRKTPSLIKIIIIFIISLFIYGFLNNFISQLNWDSKKPLNLGKKTYDFTQSVVLNNDKTFKDTADFENNKVVWFNKVKHFNNWTDDLFLFEFDDKNSTGTITQLTNYNDVWGWVNESVKIVDGKIYWIKDQNLYIYNSVKKKPELLLKDVFSILGGDKNNLILNLTSGRSLYTFNILTKQKEDTNINICDGNYCVINSNKFKFGGGNICYETKDGVAVYKMDKKQTETIVGEEIKDGSILACSKNYVAYTSQINVPGKEVDVFRLGDTLIFHKNLTNDSVVYGDDLFGVFDGDIFYYSVENNIIMSKNLINMSEKTISLPKEFSNWHFAWKVSNGYIVYFGKENISLNLQKISQ